MKGFINTLEAVLGATILLGTVIALGPATSNPDTGIASSRAQTGLETLDKTGELDGTVSASEVEADLENMMPEGYNYTVEIIQMNYSENEVSSPYITSISGSEYKELQLWIESGTINVSSDGNQILSYLGPGYHQTSIESGSLSFNGTGSLSYSVNTFSSGPSPDIDVEDILSTSYTIIEDGYREIRVKMWQ